MSKDPPEFFPKKAKDIIDASNFQKQDLKLKLFSSRDLLGHSLLEIAFELNDRKLLDYCLENVVSPEKHVKKTQKNAEILIKNLDNSITKNLQNVLTKFGIYAKKPETLDNFTYFILKYSENEYGKTKLKGNLQDLLVIFQELLLQKILWTILPNVKWLVSYRVNFYKGIDIKDQTSFMNFMIFSQKFPEIGC